MNCQQQAVAVVLLVFTVGLCGFHFSGFFINHGDIAPQFAGTLFGISNTFATLGGIIAPVVVSAMTPHGTRQEWQSAFYVAAAIYCFGALFYILMGSGEIQDWAKCEEGLGGEEAVKFHISEHIEEESPNLHQTVRI